MAIKSPAGAVPQADQRHQGARAGLLGHRHLVAGQQFLFLVQQSDSHPQQPEQMEDLLPKQTSHQSK